MSNVIRFDFKRRCRISEPESEAAPAPSFFTTSQAAPCPEPEPWHIYDVSFSTALKRDKEARDFALGKRFPTGWTELDDGTFAASSFTDGAAFGLTAADTGRTITPAEMFERQAKAEPEPAPEPAPAHRYVPAYCDPDNEFKGSKYERGRDVKDIAKLVRKDIAKAKRSGAIPKVKTSVRISRYAGGCSLNVTVKSAPPFALLNREWVEYHCLNKYSAAGERSKRYTPEAQALLETLEGFVRAYQRDNSDIQSDYWCVNFYETVEYDYDLTNAEIEAIRAEAKAE